MNEHVFIKFPDRRERIWDLLQTNTRFREACADYEEICTWLAGQERSASSEEKDRAQELIRDLEGEITEMLRDNQ